MTTLRNPLGKKNRWQICRLLLYSSPFWHFQDQSHCSIHGAKTNKALSFLSLKFNFWKLMTIFLGARISKTYLVHGTNMVEKNACLSHMKWVVWIKQLRPNASQSNKCCHRMEFGGLKVECLLFMEENIHVGFWYQHNTNIDSVLRWKDEHAHSSCNTLIHKAPPTVPSSLPLSSFLNCDCLL
jgi:hypothetical protein